MKETPEEAIENRIRGINVDTGFKQDKNKYSEEEVHKIIESYQNIMENNPNNTHYDKWFEQFKKK